MLDFKKIEPTWVHNKPRYFFTKDLVHYKGILCLIIKGLNRITHKADVPEIYSINLLPGSSTADIGGGGAGCGVTVQSNDGFLGKIFSAFEENDR